MGNEVLVGIGADFSAMEAARKRDEQAWREWAKRGENNIHALTESVQREAAAQAKNNPLYRLTESSRGERSVGSFIRQAITGDPLAALADNAEKITRSAKMGFGIGIGVAAAVGLYETFQKVNSEVDTMNDKTSKAMLGALQMVRGGFSLSEIGAAKNQLGAVRRENEKAELSRGPVEQLMAVFVKGVEYFFPKPKAFDEQSERSVSGLLVKRSKDIVRGENDILRAKFAGNDEEAAVLEIRLSYEKRIVEAKAQGLDSAAKELQIQRTLAESIARKAFEERRSVQSMQDYVGLGIQNQNLKSAELRESGKDTEAEENDLKTRHDERRAKLLMDMEKENREKGPNSEHYKNLSKQYEGLDDLDRAERGIMYRKRFERTHDLETDYERQNILNSRTPGRKIRAQLYSTGRSIEDYENESDPMKKLERRNRLAGDLGGLQDMRFSLLSKPTISDDITKIGGGGYSYAGADSGDTLRSIDEGIKAIAQALSPKTVAPNAVSISTLSN